MFGKRVEVLENDTAAQRIDPDRATLVVRFEREVGKVAFAVIPKVSRGTVNGAAPGLVLVCGKCETINRLLDILVIFGWLYRRTRVIVAIDVSRRGGPRG